MTDAVAITPMARPAARASAPSRVATPPASRAPAPCIDIMPRLCRPSTWPRMSDAVRETSRSWSGRLAQ